jgi:hypothetical protein
VENTNTVNGGAAVPPEANNDANASRIAELEAELEKERGLKETYRSGLLAVKGKANGQAETEEERIDRIINEKLAKRASESADSKARAEEESRLAKLERENAELRRAQANTPNSAPSVFGSGTANVPAVAAKGYFSDEQKAYLTRDLQSRGLYTEEQIASIVATAEQDAAARITGFKEYKGPKRKY